MVRYMNYILCTLIVVFCVYETVGNSCSPCNPDSCVPPLGCLAGRVKDSCDCCYVCGRKEGERCENEEINFIGYGKCGDNLECKVRNDLERDDPPEAVCQCQSKNQMCGSDGVTYDNICQLNEERYRRRDGLIAVSANPCIKAPKIIATPTNVKNSTGGTASMRCEAKAYPAPDIHWFIQRTDSLLKLPGNNTRIAVQSRGGPDVDETTSWLFFMRIDNEDAGTYVCKAQNDLGSATATATVSLLP